MDSRGAMIGKVGTLGLGWRHSYAWNRTWSTGNTVNFPDGRVIDFNEAYGVGEELSGDYLLLTDGGKVKFDQMQGRYPDGSSYPFYRASQIIDPYGQITQLHYQTIGQDSAGNDIYYLDRVTEPGGRYLQITLNSEGYIWVVQAFDARGNPTQWVMYTYGAPAGHDQFRAITRVDYSDGTSATYTYQEGNTKAYGAANDVHIPLIQSCNDVRYHGPMRQILYQFVQGDHTLGKLQAEVNLATHNAVSTLTFQGTAYPVRIEKRGDGLSRTFNYDQYYGTLTSYTDFTGGNRTYVSHDTNGFVNSVQDARGNTTSYTHNANGTLSQVLHNTDGSHADYSYWPSNAYLVSSKSNERTYVTYYDRDGSGRIYQVRYADGSSEGFDYNSLGQVYRHRLKNGSYIHFEYDGSGRLLKRWNPTSNPSPSYGEPYTQFDYYPSGHAWADRVWKETDPRGNWTIYEYDTAGGQPAAGRGLVTKITHVDGTYKSFVYDAAGNKIAEENENREHTDYVYDDYNRLTTMSPPAPAGPITYSYEPSYGTGTADVHTTKSVHKKTDGAGVITLMTYDENFRLKTVTDANNNKTTNDYDEVGNLVGVQDPRGYSTSYGYDGRNRRIWMTDPVGRDRNNRGHTTDWDYDVAGNITGVLHTDSQYETKAYDAMNRVTQHAEPIGPGVNKVTNFDYWPSGQLYHVTDDNGQTTWFEYEPSDLKTAMHYPDGTNQAWGYDAAENLTSRRTVGGKTQSFWYDGRNRQTNMRWDSGVNDWADFNYDSVGRLTQAQNGYAITTRTYDPAGRMTLEGQYIPALGTKQLAYSYDGAGKETSIALAGTSYAFNYTYDTVGRFSQIVYAGDGETKTASNAWFQYTYDPHDSSNNETQRLCAMNGVAQIYSRDELNRTIEIKVENVEAPQFGASQTESSVSVPLPNPTGTVVPLPSVPPLPVSPQLLPGLLAGLTNLAATAAGAYVPPVGTVQSDEQYVYDNMGRLSSATRSYDGSDTSTYGYDGTSQLTNASLGWNGNNLSYTLDHVGNRTSVSGGGIGAGSYTRNTSYMNEYTGAPAGTVYNGSEHEVQSYAGMSYSYYGDRRLASAVGNGHSYYLYYDALGRCIIRQMDGVTTYYTYDGEKPIYEWKSDGSVAGWQLYGKGIDEILLRGDFVLQWPDGGYGHGYFYQQDHEGSVTQIMSFQGTKLESYRYDPFGRPTLGAHVGSLYNNRFKFTGREWVRTPDDSFEFGFYEYRNRAYNPNLGRFMSEDPKGFDAGDYNLFRYCGNDPINKTDPMGLYALEGFTEAQRQQLEQQQKKEAQQLESAASRIEHAVEAGKESKEYKSLAKDFQKVFRKEVTPDNLSKLARTAEKMITALRDDGSKGYVARPIHEADVKRNDWPEGTFGRGTVNGKTIQINVDHRLFNNASALRWDVGHESAHNAGIGDHAYRHEAEKYQNLTPEQRLDNADSYMDFFNY